MNVQQIDPNQPHYFKGRRSIAFNLDASKPCIYCGREPWANLHYPPTVRLYLAEQAKG